MEKCLENTDVDLKCICCFVERANPFSVNERIWIQSLFEQISEVNVSIEVGGSNGG
jgi:hypothetical protein